MASVSSVIYSVVDIFDFFPIFFSSVAAQRPHCFNSSPPPSIGNARLHFACTLSLETGIGMVARMAMFSHTHSGRMQVICSEFNGSKLAYSPVQCTVHKHTETHTHAHSKWIFICRKFISALVGMMRQFILVRNTLLFCRVFERSAVGPSALAMSWPSPDRFSFDRFQI